MITIIQRGTKRRGTCKHCGCIFSFDEEDVTVYDEPCHEYDETLKCPQCRQLISVKNDRGWGDK